MHNAASPHTEPNIYIFTQPLDGICMSGAVVYLAIFFFILHQFIGEKQTGSEVGIRGG